MKRITAFCVLFAAVLLIGSGMAQGQYILDYSEDFSSAGSEAVWGYFSDGPGDSTITYLPGEEAVQLQLTGSTRTGHFTRGPGKTALSGPMTFTQSVDIYIDPATMQVGTQAVWTMEVGFTGGGEFDFYGKWLVDDGEGDPNFEDLDGDGDTTDWVYKLGRQNDWRSAPAVVEEAGWFTFTCDWIDDGVELVNHNYISQGETLLFTGDSAQSPWASNPNGYETNYMWIFGRDESTAGMKLDNLTYQATPEPATMSLLGLGAVALIRRRK